MLGSTILVAEHDDDLRCALSSLLGHAGFNVLSAEDGIDVLTKVRRHGPDLVIVGDRLPRLSGCWAARTIHEEADAGLYRTRPAVVVLVERDDHGVRESFVRGFTGADEILPKPVVVGHLDALVERYLATPAWNAA